jgi:hypothetical protein
MKDMQYEVILSVFNDRAEFARFFQDNNPVSSMCVPIRQEK